MYYCALSLEVLQHTPHISCHLCDLVCFGVQFPELSLKKILYNYLNNIDMVLLRTSCTGASSNTILNYN